MPTTAQAHRDRNVGVIQALRAHRDALTQPRDIDHFLYFPTEASRAAFIESIRPLSFTIAGQDTRDRVTKGAPGALKGSHARPAHDPALPRNLKKR